MRLLTVKETAEKLKISISMVYRLISTGSLPCFEIGSCKRISEEDLGKYLADNRKEPDKLPPNKRKHF